jgi:hypothetical protein
MAIIAKLDAKIDASLRQRKLKKDKKQQANLMSMLQKAS